MPAAVLRRVGADLRDALALCDPRRWRRERPVGSLRGFARDVRALFRDGGLAIETPADAGAGEPLRARTLIQPDGDVLAFVDPAALEDPDLVRRHVACVREAQERLAAWLASLRLASRIVLRLAILGSAGAGLARAIDAEGAAALARAFLPLALALAAQLALWLATRLVVARLRGGISGFLRP